MPATTAAEDTVARQSDIGVSPSGHPLLHAFTGSTRRNWRTSILASGLLPLVAFLVEQLGRDVRFQDIQQLVGIQRLLQCLGLRIVPIMHIR